MFLRFNLYTIVWFLLIAGLVLLPGRDIPKLGRDIISIDKAIHALLFAVLTFLMIVGFSKQFTYKRIRNKAVHHSLIITISYAIVIEVTQLFSVGRTFGIDDMAANLCGCLVGFLLFISIYK